MASDQHHLKKPPPTASSTSSNSRISGEIGSGGSNSNGYSGGGGGHNYKPHYPNPPDSTNPDPATLRDQWRYAIRQYSKWYSHAWGTAILAGLSFFALGWIIKGSNPLPSLGGTPNPSNKPSESPKTTQDSPAAAAADRQDQ